MTDELPRSRTGLPRRALGAERPPAPSDQPAPGDPSPTPGVRTALGAVPAAAAVTAAATTDAPASGSTTDARRRIRRWVIGTVVFLVLAAIAVLLARWFVASDPGRDFIETFPGQTHLPDGSPIGIPTWVSWQHFFNAFLLILMIRTGWQVRTQRKPPATWVRRNTGLLRTGNPPRKISLTLWLHLTLDALWFGNGVVFVALLVASGHWVRVVPTTWEIIPNAVSASIQYLSLDWPTENGWVNYNSLQVLAYFATIFVAAPLAAITGIRMSAAWPSRATRLNRLYPVEFARALHLPVMLYFVLFIVTHVALVLATGALRNLNHMYGGQDAVNWTGALIFGGTVVLMVGAVFAARPIVVAPLARLFGTVGR